MLMDIFSSFDPCMYTFTSISSPMIWAATMSIALLINASFWINPNWMFWLTNLPSTIMSTQVLRTTGAQIKGFNSILSPLFIMIILSNLTGLLPYVFSTTSHLIMTLSLGLPLWMSLILSSLLKAPKSTIAHLLPANTPIWLCPPLVIIESVSIMVRPITLSFRLAANMSAGHIVLSLIGVYLSSAFFSSSTSALMLSMIEIIYTIFEIGICLIQAYIFCLLLSLYADEHPHN